MNKCQSNPLSFAVEQSCYSKQAVFSAAHRWSGTYDVSVRDNGNSWVIDMIPLNEIPRMSPNEVERAFRTDLIDYQLRIDLEEGFRPIREQIVAKAFGRYE